MLNNLLGQAQWMSAFLKPKGEQSTNKPVTVDKPTTAELKYKNARKKKKRLVQASKRANRR